MRNLRERTAAFNKRHPWLVAVLAAAYTVPATTLAIWIAHRVGDNGLTVIGGTLAVIVAGAAYVVLRVAVRTWLRESRPINTFTA